MEQYKLNTNWCLWYHSINDNQWTNTSYKNLLTITTIYELKTISDIIEQIHLQNGAPRKIPSINNAVAK